MTTELHTYTLETRYDSRKSFYGKAKVEYVDIDGDRYNDLISYTTTVATIREFDGGKTIRVFGTHSPTTLRHIKEFMQQFGFPLMTKGEIEKHCMWDDGHTILD